MSNDGFAIAEVLLWPLCGKKHSYFRYIITKGRFDISPISSRARNIWHTMEYLVDIMNHIWYIVVRSMGCFRKYCHPGEHGPH